MKLLSFFGAALLLGACSLFGANVPYTAFRGTGGITISSNVALGTVTIDGSGISAGALPAYVLTNDQSTAVNLASNFRVAGSGTNVGAFRVFGVQTNINDIFIEDPGAPGVPQLWLENSSPGLFTMNDFLFLGFPNRTWLIESNLNQAGWVNQPYGSIVNQDNVNATNFTAVKTITLSGLTASRLLRLNSTLNATNTGAMITSIDDLSDPNADRVLFWDDSAGVYTFLTVGAGLSISDTTITATGGSGATNGLEVIAVNRVESDTVFNTNSLSSATLIARSYLHAAVITNHTSEMLAAGSGVLRIEGSNQFYFVNVLSNITINSGTSVLLRSNVTYGVWITNTTFAVATEASWQWRNTKSVSTAPSFQNGAYFLRVKKDFMGTNAWVEVGPSLDLAVGPALSMTTNSGVAAILLSQVLTNLNGTVGKNATNDGWGMTIVNGSVTQTNRQSETASTNTTFIQVDFSDTANVQTYKVDTSVTNLSIWTTNHVAGRTIRVLMNTNAANYAIQLTNLAGTVHRWNRNVTTNGVNGVVKTNTQLADLYLTAESDGTVTVNYGTY